MVSTFNFNSHKTNEHTLNLQASIPTELGKLSNLIYLRLSYNAFTGKVPDGLAEMKGLQLLQLQSNRITEIPAIARLNSDKYGRSTFVTDCGVPSAFEKVLECKNCTMCCEYHFTIAIACFDPFAPHPLTYFLISLNIYRQRK